MYLIRLLRRDIFSIGDLLIRRTVNVRNQLMLKTVMRIIVSSERLIKIPI